MNQSKLPLPKERHDDTIYSSTGETSHEKSDSDSELDFLGLPEVPKVSLRPVPDVPPVEPVPPEVFPATERDHETGEHYRGKEDHISRESSMERKASYPEQFVAPNPEQFVSPPHASHDSLPSEREEKQFLPFISPPSSSSVPFSARVTEPSTPPSKTESPMSKSNREVDEDLQDVLAAAHAAAESAERAAAAARSAASLAQVRITELIKKKHENEPDGSEHAFYMPNVEESATPGTPRFDHQQSFHNLDSYSYSEDPHQQHNLNLGDNPKMDVVRPSAGVEVSRHESTHHQPQRLTSLEDDPYFSYPNLFTAQNPNLASDIHSVDKR